MKSTAEELEQVSLFEKFPERKFHLGTGLHPELKGIEVNPDNIKAIEDIPDQLLSVKEVQKLTGRLAALSRFISQSSKKCHRLFELLKRKNNFEWTPECRQALKELNKYLSSPQLLSKPKEGESLLVYVAVSDVAVSAVLVREEKGT
nr:uncharacterized protein LOC104099854 [Nicotiana tomentosiformis]